MINNGELLWNKMMQQWFHTIEILFSVQMKIALRQYQTLNDQAKSFAGISTHPVASISIPNCVWEIHPFLRSTPGSYWNMRWTHSSRTKTATFFRSMAEISLAAFGRRNFFSKICLRKCDCRSASMNRLNRCVRHLIEYCLENIIFLRNYQYWTKTLSVMLSHMLVLVWTFQKTLFSIRLIPYVRLDIWLR